MEKEADAWPHWGAISARLKHGDMVVVGSRYAMPAVDAPHVRSPVYGGSLPFVVSAFWIKSGLLGAWL